MVRKLLQLSAMFPGMENGLVFRLSISRFTSARRRWQLRPLCNTLPLHRAVENPLLAYLRLRPARGDNSAILDMVIPLQYGPDDV